MSEPQEVPRLWENKDHLCVVAATGPSLTDAVVKACAGHDVVAVNDAYKLFPDAAALYACDARWWILHQGCMKFRGQKWSTHSKGGNDKLGLARRYGISIVRGRDTPGFSTDPAWIHHGMSSGFQAVNLAILFGARRIVLVGFNMQQVKGKRHFFGDHPPPLRNPRSYAQFIVHFERASKKLPKGVRIINATPKSALKCFPEMELAEALRG